MVLGFILLFPLLFAAMNQEPDCIAPFLLTAAGSFLAGVLLYRKRDDSSPSTAQAMLICAVSWIALSIAGAVPLVLVLDTSWINGVFETASGFTTTGITMFQGLDDMPRSILLWRSITQWVGGLGILTFFLAVSARVPGAHRLIGAEGHKIFSGRPVPGLRHTVKILWTIYTAMTVMVAAGLSMSGMGIFDGINHAMTALATGGFSTHDASIAFYAAEGTANSVLMEYITIFGMIAGGTSFLVHYRVFRGEGIRALFSGPEVKLWWTLIIGFLAVFMAEQMISGELFRNSVAGVFRKDLFQVCSVISSTGFTTEDLYSPFFGPAARQLFLVMMIIGSCVGSTGGGIKVLRVSILIKVAGEEIRKIFRAEGAVSGIRFQGLLLGRSEISRVAGIVFMWFVLILFGGMTTVLLSPGMDGYTAFSGMASALGNTGPCFMSPQQMTGLHWGVKIVYILGMLAGRLEILPLMLLFNRKAWR